MKTFVKIFCYLVIFCSIVLGQHTVTIQKVVGTIGNDESVTVSVDSPINIKSVTMSIKYDKNSLTYKDITNLNLPNSSPNSFFMNSEEDGVISVAWTSITAIDFSSSNLFDLNFMYDSGFSEIEILTCRMKNVLGETYNLTFSDGSITENLDSQVLIMNPVGGEYFGVTDPPLLIKWKSVFISNVNIEYTSGSTWVPIANNVNALLREYLWALPTINSTNIRLRLIDHSDTTICDTSNTFTISSSKSVEVISPNGGEVLQIGGAKVISWNFKNLDDVKIEYTTNTGTSWNIIVASTSASDGSYIWDIPNTSSANCLIKVSSVDNSAEDVSDAVFEITAAPVSISIPHMINDYSGTLPVPTTADILTELPVTSGWLTAVTSLTLKIRYDREAIDLRVFDGVKNTTSILYKMGNFIPSFDDSVITLFWLSDTPYDLVGELYLIRCLYADGIDFIANQDAIFSEFRFISAVVENVRGNTINLSLTNGSVSKTTATAVKLLQPKGGEVLAVDDSPFTIKFSTVNIGAANLKIDFSDDNGNSWSTLNNSVNPSTGSFIWDYSSYSPKSNCKIRINVPSNPTSYSEDMSGAFAITTSNILNLLSPNGGEVIQAGRKKNITWYSKNIEKVSIDFSSDGGTTWENIIPDAPALSGVYEWEVPDIISTECLISITDFTTTTVTDVSDNVFTVADNMAVVRLSRIGDLVLLDQPPDPAPPLPPWPRYNALPIFIDFENLNSITYLALQISLNTSVYTPYLNDDHSLKVYPSSTLEQNGRFIAGFSDTLLSVMWTCTTPCDLNGESIKIEGEYWGSSTDLKIISAQFFDLSGISLSVNLMNGRLSDGTVGIDDYEEITPANYFISQNYPNPFNPSTTIQFGIPEAGKVSLIVYDIMGQKVETLIDEYLNAGVHKIKWNALQNANGVYLYRIIANDFVETKKLILLK